MEEKETLRALVLEKLEKAVILFASKQNLNLDLKSLKIRIEYSRNEKFGDYSTAFLLENKDVLGNPVENSQKFLDCFSKEDSLFSNINFSNPGFINFRINLQTIKSYLTQYTISPDLRFPKIAGKEKIIFEFVSANPTGPLNIVSARAAAMGDSICNLLEKIGHEVHREFYVNDYGNQVFLLGVSCLCRLRSILGEPIHYQQEGDTRSIEELLNTNTLPVEGYRGEYILILADTIYSRSEYKSKIDTMLSEKKYFELSEFFSLLAVEENLKSQKQDLKNFGVNFDLFFSERSLHDSQKVEAVLKDLEKTGDIVEIDGKKIFTSTKYGDDKDRVVVREDGRPTYLLADIAYHKNKLDRGFDKLINIWGPDHHGYISRLKGAVTSLGAKDNQFQVLIAQQVNLLSRGEKLKMSKRLGQFQTMSDLMEFLGEKSVDVGRYFFVMRGLETPLDFDLDLAKEESDKNPVFYAQYAHARISSIFREIGTQGEIQEFINLNSTEERDRLLFWIARFNEEVLDAGKNMEPHRLATYLQNLCKSFSRFYIAKENKLKDCDESTKKGLALLCKLAGICIKECLQILGVSAPEKMERSDP